ncbi:hypothetical protein KIN20_026180 [Parelaphostrongylus tenuis]|uniref:Uncharacterized protein n=1 Tax=Parelaphostrongylus tenuis TaxID=148309 RepID=A0AAD5MZB4_PARTN|nr:hypothetical protein KIN20_026180 [Parelaphostrongylus tenuis]
MSRSDVHESLPFRAAAVRALFNLRGKELDNPVTSWEPYRPRRKKKAVKTSRRRRESSSLFCEGTSEYGNTGVSPSVHDRCSQGERTDISVDLPTYDRCLELKATDMSMVFISNDECPRGGTTNSFITSPTYDQFSELRQTDFSGVLPQYQSRDPGVSDYSIDSPIYEYWPVHRNSDVNTSIVERLSEQGNIETSLDRNPSNDELLRSDAVRPLRTAAIRALYKIRGPDLDTPVASCEQPRRRRRYKQAVKTD